MPERVTAYRLASFVNPLRTEPSSAEGRFHRAGQREPTQYLCLHPLGPWAEYARHHGLRRPEQLGRVRERAWALRVDLSGLIELDFDNCSDHGMEPDDLVVNDYRPCQDLADRLRADAVSGLVVPSAALPGTRNVVIFGPRVGAPYLLDPVSELDIPASVSAEDGRPLDRLLGQVRFRDRDPHPALDTWTRGEEFLFEEPYPA